MHISNILLPSCVGFICVLTGNKLLCSLHDDWWDPQKFARKSIDDIGLATLSYRFFATNLILTLELLLCFASYFRTTITYADILIAQHRGPVINQEVVIAILWSFASARMLCMAMFIASDMLRTIKHLFRDLYAPVPHDLEGGPEDFDSLDSEHRPLLSEEDYDDDFRIYLDRTGATYATLQRYAASPRSFETILDSVSEHRRDDEITEWPSRRWPRMRYRVTPDSMDIRPLTGSETIRSAHSDADDEMDDDSEEEAASPPPPTYMDAGKRVGSPP